MATASPERTVAIGLLVGMALINLTGYSPQGFLKKVGADCPQVVAEEVAQPEALLGLQILFAFEQ